MYRMSLHTLEALEALHRKKFCQACLIDLKDDGFNSDPNDPKELDELIAISIRLEEQKLASEKIQYRYFMLFYIIGVSFLQNKGIHHRLLSLPTEEESCKYLEDLIHVNLRSRA